MKILDRVRAMLSARQATSAEINQAIADLDVAGAEAAHADLEAQRNGMLLSATDSQLEAHDAKISAAARERDRRRAALAELDKLMAEAIERERQEAIIERHAEGLAARDQLIAAYAKADQGAVIVAAALAEIAEQLEVIRRVNAEVVVSAGRADLKINSVLGELAEHLGHQTPTRLQNISTWSLAGYWPAQSVDASRPLAKVVELPRRAA